MTCSVKQKKNLLVLYKTKNPKDHSAKTWFLGQNVCSVARPQTDGQTDTHESDYRGHPFRVSGVLPSTYHQGLAIYIFISKCEASDGFSTIKGANSGVSTRNVEKAKPKQSESSKWPQ